MGIVFRQSVKTTIIIFFGALLGALLIYLTTRYIPKEQLGFARNLLSQGIVGQQFVMIGMQYVLITFFQRYPAGDKRRKALVTLSLCTPLISVVFFTVPYLAFKDHVVAFYQPQDMPYVRKYYSLLPVLILIWSYMSLLDTYLTAQMKVAIAALQREVVLRVCNLALLGLFISGIIGFRGYLIGMVLMYGIPFLVMLFFSSRTEDFGITRDRRTLSKGEYKEIFSFALYHLLMSVSLNLLGYLDALMLPWLDKSGMRSVAVYTNAVFFASLMTMPYRAMSAAAYTALNKAYAHDPAKLSDLFVRSGLNILIVSIAMFLLITCNMQNAVAILPKGYEAMKPVVLILVAGRLVDMATGMNSELISLSKYYRFNFYITIILLVLIFSFNYFLIPRIGILGAAWGTSLALVLFNIVKMVYLWLKMRLHPFSYNTLLIFLAGGITFCAGYFIPNYSNPFLDTVLRSLMIVILYGALLLWLKPSDDLRLFLASVRKDKRPF